MMIRLHKYHMFTSWCSFFPFLLLYILIKLVAQVNLKIITANDWTSFHQEIHKVFQKLSFKHCASIPRDTIGC